MSAQKCDKSKSGYLAGKEIEHFYNLLTRREEIDVIYAEYARTTGFMSPENLVEFLMKEQREKATLADANNIIKNFEPDENGERLVVLFSSLIRSRQPDPRRLGVPTVKEKQLLSKDGFLMYLHHPETMILNTEHKEVHQDMSHPLSHYFISSSHNTYLMKDQLKGPSSTEAYIR